MSTRNLTRLCQTIGWIGNAETYTQLRLLQKNAKDLRSEMRSLRRLSQAQLSAVKEAVKDTIQIMKKTFLVNSDVITNALSSDSEPSAIETSLKSIHKQEENYQKEMKQLERDLRYIYDLLQVVESQVCLVTVLAVIVNRHVLFSRRPANWKLRSKTYEVTSSTRRHELVWLMLNNSLHCSVDPGNVFSLLF